ncbi:hypothetical protein LCGC14_0648100 [marine sediment metagenome]|uniref:Phage tail protein n=1 Tax=marine sediment metagenome TaxID=412755 RepID=A0A0F9RGT1_9ZZZZ
MAFESILVGSGEIFVAPTVEAAPVVNVAPAGNWVSLGDTDGGVAVNLNQTVDTHRVDDESGPVKKTISEEDLTIVVNLAEMTLENLARVLNNQTVTTDAGPPSTREMDLYRGIGGMVEFSVLFRGGSPYGAFNAQFHIPRAVHEGNIGSAFVKDNKTLIPVEFHALVDAAASPATEKFGTWTAQDA